MKRLLQSDAFGLGVGMALLVGLLLAAVLFVVDKHQWAQERLDELEPRYARLKGLEESRGALDAAVAGAGAALAQHTYPASQDASKAGNDAQQRSRDLFAKAGLEVVSTQVLPARQDERFDRVPLVVRLEGDLPALQAAVTALPSLAPTLFVESLSIQTIGAARPEVAQRLGIQLQLFVLRRRA